MKKTVDDLIIEGYKMEAEQYANKIVDAINVLDVDDQITLMAAMSMAMVNVVSQVMPNKKHINEFYEDLAVETHVAFDFFKEEEND